MSLLSVVGLGAIAWAVLCALVVAVCMSAKEGDGSFGRSTPPRPGPLSARFPSPLISPLVEGGVAEGALS